MRASFLAAMILAACGIGGEVSAQQAVAPPRSVADVLAGLDQFKPDPELWASRQAAAALAPPAGLDTNTRPQQELAVFYHRRARAQQAIGNFRGEIADLKLAWNYVDAKANPLAYGVGVVSMIAQDLGRAELFGGSLLQSLEWHKRIIQMLGGQFTRTHVALQTSAFIHLRLGDFSSARAANLELERAIASVGREVNFAQTRRSWLEMARGDLLSAQGNFGEAERNYRQLLDAAELDYQANLVRVQRGLLTHSQSDAMLLRIFAERRLASNFRFQGRPAEAESYARSALQKALMTYGRYAIHTATSISELGRTVYDAGRYEDARALAEAAIESYTKAGVGDSSSFVTGARGLLGAALTAQGRWRDAIVVFEERDRALASDAAQYEKLNGDDPNWGIALLRSGEGKKAIDVLGRLYQARIKAGLSDSEYFTAQARAFYGMALAADGQSEKAFTEIHSAIPALLDDARRVGGSEQGGAASRQMKLVWVIEAYMQLLQQLRDLPVLKNLGIDAVAEAFRMADVARGSAVQRALAESAARATPNDPALADLARREQDALRRFVTLSDLRNRLLSAPPDQQLPKVIADLGRDVVLLRAEREKLKDELARRFPEYAELISPKPITLGQIQAALAPDESIVSIYVGAERSYVWAVPKNGPIAFAEIALNDAEVTTRIGKLRKALDVGEIPLAAMPRFDFSQAHDLYVKLLQPVETGWRDAKNLIIVPHKALGQLPFALLTTSSFTQPQAQAARKLFEEYRQAPWLIRRASITQLPSASTLLALRRTPAAKAGRKEFIGFGDPIFSVDTAKNADGNTAASRSFRNLSIEKVAVQDERSGGNMSTGGQSASTGIRNSSGLAQLARLPDTALEINSVAKVLGASSADDIFLGRAATEKNVKSGLMDNRRVVMFATHGLVPGDLNGLTQPALALSAPEVTGNSDEDGLLTMEEVLGLKLNADWVVLSACNTAAGDGAGAEAVSGLGKAFFFAGARTLLVSNWPVETVSARILTTRLFEIQAANPLASRAEALRTTMIEMMDRGEAPTTPGTIGYSYAHPMFWAPFSLVGDGTR